jgi:hypothetical protein
MLARFRPRFLNDSLLWRLLSESLREHRAKYAAAAAATLLDFRLVDRQSQNKTVAARATADRKTFGHPS